MYTFLSKNGQTVGFLLGFVVVALFLVFALSGLGSFNGLSEADQLNTGIFDFGLSASIALIIIAAVIALVFGLIHLLLNLKDSMKFIIALAVVVGVFLVGYYGFASDDLTGPISKTVLGENVASGTSKFVSGAIWTSLALLALTTISFIVFEILNFFK